MKTKPISSRPERIAPELLGELDRVLQDTFIHYPDAMTVLNALRYARLYEAGRKRPMCIHIVGDPGMGKSFLLEYYWLHASPMNRDDDGRSTREIILIEAGASGDWRDLATRLGSACVPGWQPTRSTSLLSRVHGLLQMAGVKQILIDEVGNFLNGGPRMQATTLAFLKELSNAGYTLAVATPQSGRNVLAADEQLSSRFRVLYLNHWKESETLRQFLRALEAELNLPIESRLYSQENVRWLMANDLRSTTKIVKVIRRAAGLAIHRRRDHIDRELLEEALSLIPTW